MAKNLLVLDAEYTQPNRKLIQAGAAVYNAKTAELIDTLDIYVNPGESITPYITELTGITDQNVENAGDVIMAYESLKSLIKKHKCMKNPLVWGSGTRNDSSAIYDEYRAEMLVSNRIPDTDNFMGFRVIDVKTVYQSVQLFENKKYAGGLLDSMKELGLTFEGDAHRALNDAKNTFKIWYHLMKMLHGGNKS